MSKMEKLPNDTLIPIISEKELDRKSFIMGFHEYRAIWTPHENNVLHACMEPANKKDKFAVAVISHKNSSSPPPSPPLRHAMS